MEEGVTWLALERRRLPVLAALTVVCCLSVPWLGGGALLRAQSQPVPSPPASTAVPAASTSPGQALGPNLNVRAWVNGKAILDQELLDDAALELLQNSRRSEPERSAKRREILSTHLKRLVETELIVQDANHKLEKNTQAIKKIKELADRQFEKRLPELRKELGSEERLKEWLAIQGLTMETFRKKQERIFLANQYLGSRIGPPMDAIGNPEITDYYYQHLNQFQTVDRVEWQDLFISVGPKHPTLEEARRFSEQIIGALRAGESFEKVLQYDEGPTKGVGLGQLRGEIRPQEVEEFIWHMKVGEVGPPVVLATGVHVFRVLKRQNAGQLPLDEKVQAQIKRKLKEEVWDRERKSIIRELSAPDKAVIVYERSAMP
jgi:parvulin-like peptidyl-prolyl isomerase